MSEILANMSVVLGADVSQFKSEMAKVRKELKSVTDMGEAMKGVGESMSMYLSLPLALAATEAVRAFDKQSLAVAQVENGLRSTGNAAKFTSDQLQIMAAQIQKKSVYGDEEILQKVTTQLLTFSNISGETFARTQQAAVDLSAKLGQDLQTSAIQLGKALNDPTQSLGALRRAGISFSEEQIAVIHHLQATNQLGTAQKIILGELERQYGGTAEAASKAGLGGMRQLGNSVNDLMESFGKIILEAIGPFIGWLGRMVAAFDGLSDGTKKTIVVVLAIIAVLGPLLFIFGAVAAAIVPITAGLALISGPVVIAVAAVAALTVALGVLVLNSRDATAEFKEQKSSVENLTKTVNPLLDRYDELKAKTSLSKEEHKELQKVIQKVGEQIPTTITAFDSYGKALDINSNAARNFIKTQQEILEVKNHEALTKQREEYGRLTTEIDKATKALNTFNSAGKVAAEAPDEDGYPTLFALTGTEILKLQGHLAGLRESRRGVGGLIDELKGIKPAAEEGAEGAKKLGEAFDKDAAKAAKKLAEELKNLANELRTNTILAANLPAYLKGDGGYDAAAERIKILTNGLKKLVEDGLNPASAAFQKYLKELLTLSQAPDAKMADSPMESKKVDVKLKNPIPPEFLAEIKIASKEYAAQLTDVEIIQKNFLDQSNQMVANFPANALGDMFLSIGDAIAKGGNVFEAAGKSLLRSVANFMAEYGKIYLAKGVLDIAAGNPQGFAEVAAGGSLMIAAGVLGGMNSGGSGDSGGGGSSGSYTPRASSAYTPSQAPTSTMSAAPSIVNHKVEVVMSGRAMRGVLEYETDRLGRATGGR